MPVTLLDARRLTQDKLAQIVIVEAKLLLHHATVWFWNIVPVSISGHAPEMLWGFGGG